MNGQSWKSAAIQLAIFFPAVVFGTGFLLNFFIWGSQSSGAVPFTTVGAVGQSCWISSLHHRPRPL